jgi:hypothetical protein
VTKLKDLDLNQSHCHPGNAQEFALCILLLCWTFEIEEEPDWVYQGVHVFIEPWFHVSDLTFIK